MIPPSLAYLKTEPALFDAQMTDLSEIPGIDVRPGVPFPTSRVLHVSREIFGILVRLDHVSDTESVNVHLGSTDVEGLGCELADELGQGVRVCARKGEDRS
jgi:hypothetical protein